MPSALHPGPYTHSLHAARCHEAAQAGVTLARKRIHARRGQVVYCAEIVDAFDHPEAGECWRINSFLPERATFTVLARNTRECGDSTCLFVQCNLQEARRGSEATRQAPSAGKPCLGDVRC